MGLFHLKMACADAIWRIFIKPILAREDTNSVMHFIDLHREKETGKIGSDPGFRRMHEVITHEGVALRLDAWRVEYAKNRQMRDQQHENILPMHQYFLLYEEMSWSMNYGDIGRIETCFPPWIYIFKATGKHKYAAHMVKFMTDVHFVYPPPLRHAVRYNIVTNPDGKVGKFRGVDWVVEQMVNLPTKDTYGGRGSNYTKKRVIQESTLIQVYRQCCRNIERNFHLTSVTSHHAPPNMEKTYKKMARYLQEHGPMSIVRGVKLRTLFPMLLTKDRRR
ncbi:hypothetical protein B0H10DRAFT_2163973 [Mycena sp. CBHHK59/15]|nr:hypothetical protein B0H10DRAFT_2163973 [Mycena sp. CBHHK59/15]